ncbi:hypothetical protein BJV74DRAFT_827169 [Russula compacta]|nr:hypothetical protein BJV74DRAFT_827169 [Russula compacta]
MPNSLTRRVGLTIGPLFLETLVKHYFARVIRDGSKLGVPLRSEELLYDEAFNIVKDFLDASTRHTVEELQSFSNVRTPSPPWVHVVRFVIPMSCCDEAAVYLIKAFRGEEIMKRVVGGTKWWQVRGVRGLDAEWISAKKDWQEAKRRAKEQTRPISSRRKSLVEVLRFRGTSLGDITFSSLQESEGDEAYELVSAPGDNESSRESGAYQPEMDDMRCVLYSHGGGYYFGSVDQERLLLIAVNYRLAPQYPFPCAIQDLLAAYLFLIRPPEGAAHQPVKPERIVIAGDSAGGGLSLALLQVIRDSGLPAPAGGVLISPWCDFTHSFPSIFTNTDTDVIPTTGLSLHKPSPLWPPPSNDISSRVHSRLRNNINDVLKRRKTSVSSRTPQGARPIGPNNVVRQEAAEPGTTGIDSTPLFPGIPDADQSILLKTVNGETIEVAQQIQLYAPNGLLKHPLVSPALSYLGGLPPLLFIAGEREVLRDEIIYAAHRASHPEQFPLRDEIKNMYPAFKHVDTCMEPTPVHLQVYDDVAHVLPILFPFTTPGKYCYRAMALFSKHVTSIPKGPLSATEVLMPPGVTPIMDYALAASPTSLTPPSEIQGLQPPNSKRRMSFTSGISRAATTLNQQTSGLVSTPGDNSASASGYSVDVAGPRIGGRSESHLSGLQASSADRKMIRERVSTHGIIRPLEPEAELLAMQVSSEVIGTFPERAIQRYITGKKHLDKKFANGIKRIEKQRVRNINRASRDMNQHISVLQHYLDRESKGAASGHSSAGQGAAAEEDGACGAPSSWNMAWALDEDERPPPSSIVARRDTEEALKLARVADEVVLASERTLSANNLWSVVVNFLTDTPDEPERKRRSKRETQAAGSRSSPNEQEKKKTTKAYMVGTARKQQTARIRSFWRRRRRLESEPGSGSADGGILMS